MSLVGNWKKEAERFAPELPLLSTTAGSGRGWRLPLHCGRGPGAELRPARQPRTRHVEPGALGPRGIRRGKNIKSRHEPAQAVRALKAADRVALTGTPVENHLCELWSILEFINPDLSDPPEFRHRFAVPVQRHDVPRRPGGAPDTGPFVLRRLKSDKSIISDLPEKLEMKV